jgi:hypothetical protein
MPKENEYRVFGLTKLDALELRSDPAFRLEENKIPDGNYGELTTITAYVAVSGITALASFLLRKHRHEDFFEEVEEVRPDGSVKRRVVKWTRKSSEGTSAEADVIKQIRGEL